MKQYLLVILFFTSSFLIAQDKGTISGLVLDHEVNNEPLPYTIVSIKGTSENVMTDLDGKLNLVIEPGTYTLSFNFPGYKKVILEKIEVVENKTTKLDDVILKSLGLPQLVSTTSASDNSKPKK